MGSGVPQKAALAGRPLIRLFHRGEKACRQVASTKDRNDLDRLADAANIHLGYELGCGVQPASLATSLEMTIWAPLSFAIASRRLATFTALPMTVMSTFGP